MYKTSFGDFEMGKTMPISLLWLHLDRGMPGIALETSLQKWTKWKNGSLYQKQRRSRTFCCDSLHTIELELNLLKKTLRVKKQLLNQNHVEQ